MDFQVFNIFLVKIGIIEIYDDQESEINERRFTESTRIATWQTLALNRLGVSDKPLVYLSDTPDCVCVG